MNNDSKNSPVEASAPQFERYARQIRFTPFGLEGQRRLAESTVLVVGCGALGSVVINTLARAGVGKLRIVDRDYLELNNLQRQVLFDEHDVANGLPKAVAAQRRLAHINSQITIEPQVVDFDHRNAKQLASGVDIIIDGTDNFETRFLINDLSLTTGIPWVYGGCVASEGQSMTVIPGTTACLRCLMIDGPPPPGTTPTCDSAGILGPVVNVIASWQSIEAIKVLSGHADQVKQELMIVDLWTSQVRQMDLSGLSEKVNCPACQRGEHEWLEGKRQSESAVLCGRGAVQIRSTRQGHIDLEALEERLLGSGEVERNEFLLRFTISDYKITVFPDGRAIVAGTDDIGKAKSVFAQWIGN